MAPSNIILDALETGTIVDDPLHGFGWEAVRPRVERMLDKVNQNVTLFLGAAASSFKPTAFPAWDKFIELVYTSHVDEACQDLGDNSIGGC